MEQKQVKTEGSLKEMAQYSGVDQKTVEEAINLVEQTANIEVEVPQEKK